MKRYLFFSVILTILFSSTIFAQKHMQTENLGNAETIHKQGDYLLIKTKEAEARVYIYSPTIIRVNITKNFDEKDASFAVIQNPLNKVDYVETMSGVEVKTSAL